MGGEFGGKEGTVAVSYDRRERSALVTRYDNLKSLQFDVLIFGLPAKYLEMMLKRRRTMLFCRGREGGEYGYRGVLATRAYDVDERRRCRSKFAK